MRPVISGAAQVAGVVGAPVRQSLSPLIHNAWITAAGLDAVYAPFAPRDADFERLVGGLVAGGARGVNVTLPFKQRALALADHADAPAVAAGAANLLLFHPGGGVEARNTDGVGLLAAFAEQAPEWRAATAPVVVFGAGGAALGAVAALLDAGAQVRVANRTFAKAEALAARFPGVCAIAPQDLATALRDAGALVNATSAGLGGAGELDAPLEAAPTHLVVMDMVYAPLETALLRRARARGLATVDGLAMLIGQARPSFTALFGAPVPGDCDVRGLALLALGRAAEAPVA